MALITGPFVPLEGVVGIILKAVVYAVISLAMLVAVRAVASAVHQPISVFETVVVFQLSMGICWLTTIAGNTTTKSE